MNKMTSLLIAMVAAFSIGCVEAEDNDRQDDDVVVVDEQPDGGVVVDDQPDAVNEETRVAAFDNDSQQNPAQDEFLSITGTRELIHTNEISFPQGDQEDFVRFELPNNSNTSQRISVTLDCALDGQSDAIVRAFITEDGQVVGSVMCNDGPQNITIDNSKAQDVRIAFSSVNAATFVDYTLTVAPF